MYLHFQVFKEVQICFLKICVSLEILFRIPMLARNRNGYFNSIANSAVEDSENEDQAEEVGVKLYVTTDKCIFHHLSLGPSNCV